MSLFDLLPAVYRLRDAQIAATMALLTAPEQAELDALHASPTALTSDQKTRQDELEAKATRGPLQSLLMVLDEQLAAMAEDLDQLYDDQFIETCAPWVIPYIGDLIGYRTIQGLPAAIDDPRSEVANTITLRRRKGTLLVLEQLARDITGWGAHAVEFFETLGVTQYAKHVRRWSDYAPDVRRWEPRLYRNSGFSRMTRKVDVRALKAPGLPRPNLQNLGVFLWSLGAHGPTNVAPVAAAGSPVGAAACFRLNTLGMDMPLFHAAVPQGDQIGVAATFENVPDRLHGWVLKADLAKGSGAGIYGEGASLALYLNGQLLDPYQIEVANLSGADGAWINLPTSTSPYAAVIDPELGRVALPPTSGGGKAPTLTASYFYGFNGDMGGGAYARAEAFAVVGPAADVLPYPDTKAPARYASLAQALQFAIVQAGLQGRAAVEVRGNGVFNEFGGAGAGVDLPTGVFIELRAADGSRPTVLLDSPISVTGGADSGFALNGLLLGASPTMVALGPAPAGLVVAPAKRPTGEASQLATLAVTDCTLAPGWAVTSAGAPVVPGGVSLALQTPGLEVTATHAILGSVRADTLVTVKLCDSLIDATGKGLTAYASSAGLGGGALTLEGCTAVGQVHAQELTLVSNSIVWATARGPNAPGLVADRVQTGCVRFSFLPAKSITPRRFECVEQALASVQPIFASLQYGDPAYGKLWACTDDAVRRGADDGGEMGAFHFMQASPKERDLRLRLQEYLPVGLEVGLIYQS
jgi:hypothetical protein